MREIKFRAWDDKDKKWLLGYELQNLGGFSMFGEVMAFGEWTRLLSSYNLDDWKYIKIMQFTGLKDKNGKEIYDGDIIGRRGMDNTFVEYYKCRWVLRNDTQKVEWRQDLHNQTSLHLEVIGNIYENPELLK